MKKLSLSLFLMATIALLGCSDDDNPTGNGGNNTIVVADSTVWSTAENAWISNVNASSYTTPIYFSFADTTNKALDWHLSFKRFYINLNGGDFGATGDAFGVDLGLVDYDSVSIDDTVNVNWLEDANTPFFNSSMWYSYNPITHQITYTGNVLSMVDVEGDNYIKFTVDSIVGGGAPPAMGTVHLTYYYQPTANSLNLSGVVVHDSILVDASTGYVGYYDFSSGNQVTPANPENSDEWDIMFSNYELMQNSGPHGSGFASGYRAFDELSVPTAIDSFTTVETGTVYLPDFISSVFYLDGEDDTQNWYDYQPENNHLIVSWGRVYLIKTEGKIFKMKIISYYDQSNGNSGHITFKWLEL